MITPEARRYPDAALESMHRAIAYRGRDAQGAWQDEGLARLLHTRLSIIDLEDGGQPMTDVSGRFVIVFNGEVYNYLELRREYAAAGARFRTHSDTEVILEGFKLKGARVCADLNGMFAFAVWDTHRRELFFARDHLGKKPFFWCMLRGVFCFASTLEAFRDLPGWHGAFSRAGIAQYGLLGAFPEDQTVYAQARALPYACRGWFRPGDAAPRVERYWRMDFRHKARATLGALTREYEALLTDAVALRLRADVPVALTFSGGVDSGTIAALCARRLGRSLACYTIDYHTPEDPSEETLIAERVARMLSLDWQHIQFDYHVELFRDLEAAYALYDQPCQQLALVYSQRLYRCIRPHATVVLSGNGADELFAGYVGNEATRRQDVYRSLARAVPGALARWLPQRQRDWLSLYRFADLPVARYHRNDLGSYAAAMALDGETRDEVAATFSRIADEAEACGVDSFMDLAMFVSLTTGASDTNYRLPDISGLDAQVEVRSPFLDHRMVEFAARLPHRYKIRRVADAADNKFLPKRYYASLTSRDVAWASKKGMGWNLRWGEKSVTDAGFSRAFDRAYDSVEAASLDASSFRAARRQFVADVRAGRRARPTAGPMMNGFMLGTWLAQRALPRAAAGAAG